MQYGVKFIAHPTAQQRQVLSQWMGCARAIYNAKCQENKYFYHFLKNSLNLTGHKTPIDQTYAQFKTEATLWLKNCPSQILRNSASNWYNAYQNYFKGIVEGQPKPKAKGMKDSVWLTNELFAFIPDSNGELQLHIGTKKHNLGILNFKAHRIFMLPNSIHISKKCGIYYVSFSYESDEIVKSPWEHIEELVGQGEAAVAANTLAFDRGVKIQAQASDGMVYNFTPEQQATLKRKERNIKHYQKRLARQIKNSNRFKKQKNKISKAYVKMSNVRNDFSHKTSHEIVNSEHSIFVFEDLKILNMVRKAKPKKNKGGKYVANGRRAKAGLNKAILNSCWGKLVSYVAYKAFRLGKLVIKVPPHYSSQECAKCHHTHPDNRKTQSEFVCLGCGHFENADVNASEVLQWRGVALLLDHGCEDWEMSGNVWKLKVSTRGTRGSARGGKCKPKAAELSPQSLRNVNQLLSAS